MSTPARPVRRLGALAASATVLATALTVVTAVNGPSARAADWSDCLTGPTDRQAVFERASQISGVPEAVLLGVSYQESRWDSHGSSPSTSGGYGPMHLTETPAVPEQVEEHASGKGDPSVPEQPPRRTADPSPSARTTETVDLAHRVTGLSVEDLKADPVANICGGAAVLATYQREAGGASELTDWSAGVAAYSGSAEHRTAVRFAEQVFAKIRTGEQRRTNDGHLVQLPSVPSAQVEEAEVRKLDLVETDAGGADCPTSLACQDIPAPYEWYGEPDPLAYGNHDLGERPKTMDIDYIIIHDTEATWDTTLDLVTDPTYLAWNYSLRSSDGQVAQHVDNSDVGWHAGNWYVNMHSIGLEHEGFAAKGASWYTESMYQTSAELVRYLAAKYDVPLDRAHIIGHDQIPGVLPQNVAGMHWDPGPYWDWEHYMELLRSPIKPDRRGKSDVVTVKPGFAGNDQPLVGCETAGVACEQQGTNFVYLHSQPSEDSPLVSDIGLRPSGAPSTTQVSDIGARVAAGHELLVERRVGDWLGVWYLGQLAWLHSPKADPVVVPSQGQVVVPKGDQPVPVYGRAYPERSAYPATIAYQTVAPLQYRIQPGQAYVVADTDIESDYYYAKSFDCAHIVDDCTQVVGEDRYYLIWFGHRMAYVRAADVDLVRG